MKSLQSAAAAVVVVVVNSVVGAGCDTRCNDVKGPIGGTAIEEGIAGFGAAAADVCGFVCQCESADLPLAIAGIARLPVDNDDALQLRDDAATNDSITMSGGKYEHGVAAGGYLLCDGLGDSDCVFVEVKAGEVTTVNLVASLGTSFRVFAGDGSEITKLSQFSLTATQDEGE